MVKTKGTKVNQGSELQNRQLFNVMSEGVALNKIVYDKAGQANDYKITAVNPAFEKMTGIKKHDILRKRASKVYGTGSAPFLAIYAKVAAFGKPASFETYFPPMKKHFHISVFSTGKGKFGTVFMDVTESKRTEEKLAKAKDKLELRFRQRTKELSDASKVLQNEITERKRAVAVTEAQNKKLNEVLDMLPAYMILLSPDYHVPFANRFFRERFGESHGKRCFEYLFNRTEPCEVCETYKVLKTNSPLEWEWTGPDGHNYYIYDFPFIDGDGTKLIMEVGIDITGQKQAQQALIKARDELELRVQERTKELKESEENFRRIVETANEGIWTSELDGKTTFVNQKMANMLGYTREEMIDKMGAEFLVEGQQSLAAKIRGELSEGVSIQREFQFRRKDGAVIWTLATGTSLVDENGRYVGNLYMHTDITERKGAETEIAYLASFPELNPNPVLELDKSGNIHYINPSAKALYPDLAARGSRHPFLTGWADLINKIKDDKIQILTREINMGQAWYMQTVTYLSSANSFRMYAMDITEGKKAEEALRETKDYLENLINYANAPIIVWNTENKITRFNHAFERLTGLTANEALGKKLDILFPKDSREASLGLIRKAVTGERWEVVEIPILKTDGTVRTVLWNSATLFAPDNKTVVATIAQGQDITELKNAQEKLLSYERLATIGKVSGSIAHELRNPLAVIDSSIFYLEKILPSADERVKNHLNRMASAIHRCTSVIEALLKLTHPEELRVGRVDVKTLVNAVLTEYCPTTVQTIRDFPTEEVSVRGDEEQLSIACRNIVTNAVQAMNGSGTLTVIINTSGNVAEISFKDTGPGIPPDNINKIFEPLFTTKAKGIGLGLPIAKAVVETHQGTIMVVSEPGKGATFTMRLPLSTSSGTI